ncbi:acyl-CoA dehydrogenase family protein [Nonomuraea typhae]|uniref:acyl-CoA dehydrogenase family protein n=1 Tax=Nonomuraea typhae TaxID=2603600 RepID=UPI0012F9A026|nr:acyl-CoA dehydrogenase family protein [Nonomuraea typhae]
MDFALDDTQQELRELAVDLLARDAGEDRLREAGLLGVCLPEEVGGAGLGAVGMAVVLREIGARDLPALPVLAASLTITRYGTREQQARLGQARVSTVALKEPGRAPADPPETRALYSGGWALTGRKCAVPYGAVADVALVSAAEGLFLARPDEVVPEFASTGEPLATLVFDRTPAEKVADDAEGALLIYMTAVAAQASGVLAGALELTKDYIKTRKQFGRSLAEFQAVTMQIADVYIASRALDVAMWSAAWGVDNQGPAGDVALAAYHVSEAFTALFTCQHLHGGLGLDVTYPLHKSFAHAKHLSHLLGGADAQLDLIGALA